MNDFELVFHQALQSVNPQAIINIAHIFNERGDQRHANALLKHAQRVATGFGVDIPSVPIPPGYRRAGPKEITKPVLKFANKALQHALPIGKQQLTIITKPDKTQQVVMALTEVHYDNHPARPKQGYKAYEGPEFLHPGISILVSESQPSETVASNTGYRFPTEAPGTLHSNNIYAGCY